MSLTKKEYEDIKPGEITEIDLSNARLLQKDISEVTYQMWKDIEIPRKLKECKCTKK
jgi:hypothetical protein